MSSLWFGEDHLVYVRGSGMTMPFSEECKRYCYRDIQVVSIAKTSRAAGIVLYCWSVAWDCLLWCCG